MRGGKQKKGTQVPERVCLGIHHPPSGEKILAVERPNPKSYGDPQAHFPRDSIGIGRLPSGHQTLAPRTHDICSRRGGRRRRLPPAGLQEFSGGSEGGFGANAEKTKSPFLSLRSYFASFLSLTRVDGPKH